MKHNDSLDNRSSYGLNWGKDTKQLASEWCHEVNGLSGFSLKYANENRDLIFEWECNKHSLPWSASISERILGGGNCPVCERENDVSENLLKRDKSKSFAAMTMGYSMALQGVQTTFIDPKGDMLPMQYLPGLEGRLSVFDLRNRNKELLDIRSNEIMDDAKTKPEWGVHTERLLREWDYKENGTRGIYPMSAELNVRKNAPWWACETRGHTWQADISIRVSGQGCPFCVKLETE